MERDERLTRERIDRSDLPSILRLYSWDPPAVSIGFQQKIETVDIEACERHGIDVVRRPTGGRAVLHKNELTYAVITRAEPADGLYTVHNRIVHALVRSIGEIGNADIALTVTARSQKESALPVACFASAARHEVTWLGRKVIGSAQRRFGQVVLQHGSILLAQDHLELAELLNLPGPDRTAMQDQLARETATLSDVFGKTVSIAEAAHAIKNNFVKNYLQPNEVLAANSNTIDRES